MSDDIRPSGETFVRSWGQGSRECVGLHGWNGSHHTFEPLVPHLPDEFHLHAPDLPGYGRTPPPACWSLEGIATRVAEALAPRLENPVTLIGNCSGAAISLFVADELETEVEQFVLVDPFAYVPWYLRLFLMPVAGPLAYRATFDTTLGRRLTDLALADKRDEGTELLASFADTPSRVPLRYLHLLADLDFPPPPADHPADKLLLEAEHTFDAVRTSVQMWRSIWPRAARRRLAGGGHLLLEEVPAAIAAELERT
ncbi:MAG: alpha/beta fold hydrolase [Bradymonadaceae bacterium]